MNESGCSAARSISFLCSLGLFLAGYIFYTSSLIEPLYAAYFQFTDWQIGLVQSSVPLGAMVGAVCAGWLGDYFGRRHLLMWSFLLLVAFGLVSALSFDFYSLFITRSINGFLAGTLYPLCAAYLIEMTSHASLARQSAMLMFVNCLAAPLGCIAAIFFSFLVNETFLWRILILGHALPALAAFFWIKQLPESHAWLLCEKRINPSGTKKSVMGFLSEIKIFFNPAYKNITLCLMGSWFLMDIAYYGINFFIPYLLQIIQIKPLATLNPSSLLSNETIWGTFIINLFFTLSAFAAIFAVERISLISLQKYGFLLSSLSLFFLGAYFYIGLNQYIIIILLFVLFNFALNIGPDVTTYLFSATSYPVEIRASGHGMVAGFAKLGSVLGVLLLPQLQAVFGYQTIIFILSFLLFGAYLLTINFAKVISKETYQPEAGIIYETN